MGKDPYPGHLMRVVQGLEDILAGVSAGTAFDLDSGKGNKRTPKRELRDQWICAEIEELRRAWGPRSMGDALNLVAYRYALSEDTVASIYKEHHRKKKGISNGRATLG